MDVRRIVMAEATLFYMKVTKCSDDEHIAAALERVPVSFYAETLDISLIFTQNHSG